MIKYHFSAKTDVGLVRQANEDFLGNAQTPNGHVFVVCDGMGGHVGGARASKIAVNSILEFFSKEIYENIFTAIDRSLQFANEQIFAVTLNEPEMKGMGTTAVVLVIKGDNCFIGHVGDSRIYLKSNNKLNRITKDHSFVQNLVDQGIISDDEAENHPKKNQILKALGISPNIEPTIANEPILVKTSDVFLMCSDGLSGMINDQSMEMMIDESKLDRSASVLIQAACDGGGHDNITVTLVGITDSPHLNSVFKNYNPITASNFHETHLIENVNEKKNLFSKKIILILSITLIFLSSLGTWFYLKVNNQNSDEGKGEKDQTEKKAKDDRTEKFDDSGNKREKGQKEHEKVEQPKKKSADSNPNKSDDKSNKEIKKEDSPKKEDKAKEDPKNEEITSQSNNCGKTMEYEVKSGDSFDKIMPEIHKNCPKTSKEEIMKKNNIEDEKKLRADTKLKYECKCD